MACGRVEAEGQSLRADLGEPVETCEDRAGFLRRHDEADLRHAADGGADRHFDFDASVARGHRRRVAVEGQRHRLGQRLAVCEPIGPWQFERPHVSLVGGVRPVALVLRFERISFHAAGRFEPWPNDVGDRSHRLEGLPRVDEVGQARMFARAVDVLDDDGRAGEADNGMENTEAAAIGPKIAGRPRLDLEAKRAVGAADNHG